jgi:alkylated DNA repair dioxygenase AlkB
MTVTWQCSLFDSAAQIGPRPLAAGVRRTELTAGAWIDLFPGWITGADLLFDALIDSVNWRAERRPMYDRVVAVPRLLCHYGEDVELPHPALAAAKQALDEHYEYELGARFSSAGLCLYRDGRDSVTWHGDTVAREMATETMVAIVSLGAPRVLALRPREGHAPTIRQRVGHGDLLVMGGTCQRTWEHAVPKTARPVGPRISVQFRPRWVE